MNKIPEGKFCKMYKVDGATIKTDTCEGIREKLHLVISRDDKEWYMSVANERLELLLQVPFNEALADCVEEILRVTKQKNGEK